jgi:hypothetical protein
MGNHESALNEIGFGDGHIITRAMIFRAWVVETGVSGVVPAQECWSCHARVPFYQASNVEGVVAEAVHSSKSETFTVPSLVCLKCLAFTTESTLSRKRALACIQHIVNMQDRRNESVSRCDVEQCLAKGDCFCVFDIITALSVVFRQTSLLTEDMRSVDLKCELITARDADVAKALKKFEAKAREQEKDEQVILHTKTHRNPYIEPDAGNDGFHYVVGHGWTANVDGNGYRVYPN